MNQDTIDASVDRFVNSTSGPLRDMMSQGQNTENLKLLFRDTNASAEAVMNGAALEKDVERTLNDIYPLLAPSYRQEFKDRAAKGIIPRRVLESHRDRQVRAGGV